MSKSKSGVDESGVDSAVCAEFAEMVGVPYEEMHRRFVDDLCVRCGSKLDGSVEHDGLNCEMR
jgi:hypothetical protein